MARSNRDRATALSLPGAIVHSARIIHSSEFQPAGVEVDADGGGRGRGGHAFVTLTPCLRRLHVCLPHRAARCGQQPQCLVTTAEFDGTVKSCEQAGNSMLICCLPLLVESEL